jgi:micrococcal nuclease
MYDYYCTIVRVIDGDTVEVDINLGFGIVLNKRHVRIFNIDAPSIRTTDQREKHFGLLSKKRAEELLPVGSKQVLYSELDRSGDVAHGMFGRILGDFQIGDKRFTEIMLDEGYAVIYKGSAEQRKAEIMLLLEKMINEGKIVLDTQ